jgi:hypothetical protein
MSPGTKLACGESIADLWGYPDCEKPVRPSTEKLFATIAAEASGCLKQSNWDERIRRMENILNVIKGRMNRFWESWHESELDKLFLQKKREVNSDVEKDD